MKTRQTLLLGLAGLGFVLVLPAQAASSAGLLVSEYKDAGFVLAKRDESERYESRPDIRDDARAKGNKKVQPREVAPEHQDYGYGYERRQQPPRNNDHRD